MSERNHNHDVNDSGRFDDLHEELCAFVLGELDGPAVAKIEAALADSPELREERDRIEATIGLVRSACGGPGGESLSPEIRGTIESAARPAPAPRVWYLATPFRVAAGFAAVAGGLIWGKALLIEPPASTETTVAWLEREIANEGAELRRSQTFKLEQDFDVEVAQGAVVTDGLLEGSSEAGSPRERQRELYEKQIQEFLAKEKASASRPADKATAGGAGPHIPFGGKVTSPIDGANRSESYYAAPGGGGSGGALQQQGQVLDTPQALVVDSRRRGGAGGGAYKGTGEAAPPAEAPGLNAAGAPSSGFFYDKGADGDVRARTENLFLSAGLEDRSKDTTLASTEESLKRARKKNKVVAGQPATPPAGTVAPPDTEGLAWSELSKESVTEVTAGLEELASLGYVGGETDLGLVELGDSEGTVFGRDHARTPVRRQLTPAELEELCRVRVDRILQDCRRHPQEKPSAMFFRFWGDNPFVLAQLDNQSTFGVDVDTASYALARRYLSEGHLPQKEQIRTEEFVNYFKPDVASPLEETFAIQTDLAPSRFGGNEGLESQRWMMRVVVRGKEISATERKPVNLTFVVDTSGSMKENDRLELVKHALRLLTTQLDVNDSIAIIAFSNEARMVLPMTSMANRGVVEAAIYGLQPDGGTNAEAGLRLGYEVATASLAAGLTHRVVLLSDGVANVGQTDQNRINSDVKRNRDLGIYLNTIGVGMNNHNDVFLEQLANKGDGLCNYIDSAIEAKRALVDNFTGAIEPIARDVKIQVEFDKTQVYRHRLLGYENRAIADVDFRNDAIDAGEIGSGHQVVALYELEMTGLQSSEPMATVRLRWKQPIGVGRDPLEDTATETAHPVSFSSAGSWEGVSGGYRRSVLVAQFAEILRRSVHARGDSLDELIAESAKLDATLGDPDFTEFVALLQKSRELIVRYTPRHDDLTLCIDAIRRNRILHAQYEELRRGEKRAVIDELERQNAQLEARIRELIRGEVIQEMR